MPFRYYHFLILLFLTFSIPKSQAQEVLSGIAKSEKNMFNGYLFNENDELSGYYKYGGIEKIEKDVYIVRFLLLDLNLDTYAEFDIELLGSTQIYELSVVDQMVGIVYIDVLGLHFYAYNLNEGKIKIRHTLNKILSFGNNKALYATNEITPKKTYKNKFIKSFPNGNFIVIHNTINNQNIIHYNVSKNEATTLYKDRIKKSLHYLYANDQFIYIRVDEEHGRGKVRLDLMDVNTGELTKTIYNDVFDKSFIVKSILPNKDGNIVLAGVYNQIHDLKNPHKKPNNGIAFIETDIHLNIKNQIYQPWSQYNNNKMNISENGKLGNKYNLYVHEFIKDTIGNIHMAAGHVKVNFYYLKLFPLISLFAPTHVSNLKDISLFELNNYKVVNQYIIDYEKRSNLKWKYFNKRNKYLYMLQLENDYKFSFNGLRLDSNTNSIQLHSISKYNNKGDISVIGEHQKYVTYTSKSYKAEDFKIDKTIKNYFINRFEKILIYKNGSKQDNLIIENLY